MIGGAFLILCGCIATLMAITAHDWRERAICSLAALGLVIGGTALALA